MRGYSLIELIVLVAIVSGFASYLLFFSFQFRTSYFRTHALVSEVDNIITSVRALERLAANAVILSESDRSPVRISSQKIEFTSRNESDNITTITASIANNAVTSFLFSGFDAFNANTEIRISANPIAVQFEALQRHADATAWRDPVIGSNLKMHAFIIRGLAEFRDGISIQIMGTVLPYCVRHSETGRRPINSCTRRQGQIQ